MENLETQKAAIKLGKLLVKEMNLDPGVDTLSRWMAHFISEKICLLETETDPIKKTALQEGIFSSVLQLWRHRWTSPARFNPVKSFEGILLTIKQLTDQQSPPFFIRPAELVEIESRKGKKGAPAGTRKDILAIDRIAKIWIDSLLREKAADLVDEGIKESLSLQIDRNDFDLKAVAALLEDNVFIHGQSPQLTPEKRARLLQKIQDNISSLKEFEKLNKRLLSIFTKAASDLTYANNSIP